MDINAPCRSLRKKEENSFSFNFIQIKLIELKSKVNFGRLRPLVTIRKTLSFQFCPDKTAAIKALVLV